MPRTIRQKNLTPQNSNKFRISQSCKCCTLGTFPHESKLWKENGREWECWAAQHFLHRKLLSTSFIKAILYNNKWSTQQSKSIYQHLSTGYSLFS